MSRTFSNRDSRVHFREYLTNINEPEQTPYDGAETELDVGLVRSSFYKRRRLNRVAKRLRRYGG